MYYAIGQFDWTTTLNKMNSIQFDYSYFLNWKSMRAEKPVTWFEFVMANRDVNYHKM